ncbi:MAG: FtsX-like permease family protein [Prolixibacteraceae bacterium]|jgi:putative ABC transport system permease protein|nr:FtsX-like permease family protein [Prolixibacteraceae bacterium]MBT6006744.1 FtsX-like permease family protein [Prolixibacteraceae bacterium]MBT6764468.1 FtsX-like permease family protein [Prolixibacteraceae bacterium]MBT6999202.1 FtsX-like permease family protein [Prolixibacteraceae bacterium]MBT7393315.1 FtsX-like permease family protein [Prolixibacteraceae bacterium]
MNINKLVLKEIVRRKLNFFLGLISVVFAVTTVTGALTMLKIHDLKTGEIIAQKELETSERMIILEDDYRKIMKNLGFNLLILPKDQNLNDLYADDFASKYMPESFVDSLAASPSMLIRHLLPSLQQKIEWPEKRRTIILTGVRGEVPFLHKDPKEPMMVAVPKGTMIVGYELHNSLDIKTGDELKLMGRTFKIEKCNEARGNKDDITIWIDLQEAQELLQKEEEINAILALKCHCSGSDLASVRDEVYSVLPGTQVIEKGTSVLARAEARDRAAKEAQDAILSEKIHRNNLRKERENFASILVPLVLLTSTLWIAFLFIINVRSRKSEIGILRAVGVKEISIMKLFLYKALLIGLSGAFIGYFLGFGIGSIWGGLFSVSFFSVSQFALTLLFAPLLALLAAYIPATIAARQDPAEILRED